jgi:transmembrane sensor
MTTTPSTPPEDEGASERWEALARYLEGESPSQEVEALERWLAEDPRRRQLLDALNARLRSLTATPPAGLDVEAALGRVRSRMQEPEVIPLPRPGQLPQEHARAGARRTLLKAAAVAAIALGGGLLWQALRVSAPTSAAITHATAVGQTDSVTLADGSRVLLGPDSRISVAEGYGQRGRDVELSGEARFEVVHDDALPFTVRAGTARVEDLGTAFTVRAAGDGEVRVVVTEGSVRLAGATSAAGSGVVLNAGDRGRIAGQGAPMAEPAAATETDLAWTQGRLVFEDANMARVSADLRRWYGVELRIDDPALASLTVRTEFPAGESVGEVLRVIGLALGAQIEMRGDTAVMTPGAAPPR